MFVITMHRGLRRVVADVSAAARARLRRGGEAGGGSISSVQ
jgi:hypothetical protein